ncbi:uncharacterized protein LOC123321847 [Coccinella septempunctata]|uniref:uncharacterized protein LOC123321847 n=1 Tax=Coccinella septempunctata TaxID=41139 RepID=UPI001D078D79|nr:uncharacterized protein LOC123321847 [Coccinella septempunctata]
MTELDPDKNYIIASFDIVNLYTNIPVDESLIVLKEYLEEYINSDDVLNLDNTDVENISKLCEVITEQNFFIFDNTIYLMKDGLPMGLPSSGLIADAYVDKAEKQIMQLQNSDKIILWRRYVDDIFVIWSGTEQELSEFFDLMNSKFKIKFSLEKSVSNCINFLDLTISLEEGNIFSYNIYRKPTQTDLIIPHDSYHAPSAKKAAFSFLFRRLLNVPMSTENYKKEIKTIYQIGENNQYSDRYMDTIFNSIKRKIIIDKIYPHTSTNDRFISIPFYRDLNPKLISTLKKYNYTLSYRRHATLENLLINCKKRREKEEMSGVYKISCRDCESFYIGMTTRNMKKRFNEHLKNRPISALGEHLKEKDHSTNFDNLKILHKETNYHKITLLEQYEILRKKNDSNLLNDISDFRTSKNIFKLITPCI